jgi:sulfhydrogenase subunit beta (sulfur reductase)
VLNNAAEAARSVIDRAGLQELIEQLAASGHDVIGPHLRDGAIVLEPISRLDDLPIGLRDDQDAGRYRTLSDADGGMFAHTVPVQGWKRYLYPPSELVWRGRRDGNSFAAERCGGAVAKYAFLGVRSCDLAAIRKLDAVFGGKRPADPRYVARREAGVIIAVSCGRAAATCFCASMETGPRPSAGYDLLLTELNGSSGPHRFTVAAGSRQGKALLELLPRRPATEEELAAEAAAVERARREQTRSMVPDVEALVQRNIEHRLWGQVAARCLGCANCTLVCPTCFCASVDDTTDLGGQVAERRRHWDSCFTLDFSHIHGGSIRHSGAARYRQWMTHKLSSWWQQFGSSGCVGCGRCIAWCPVGIDITEEARNLHDSEGGAER